MHQNKNNSVIFVAVTYHFLFVVSFSNIVMKEQFYISYRNIQYIMHNSVSLSVCLSVCFNSSETAIGASIKLETINQRPLVSVIIVFVTS